jgi:membrane-anchored protein YejM (alkaline phosphatase superfamily)
VAPTILTELLGCTNPPSDCSSGTSLFAGAPWDWLVVTSNREFAVVEPDRVTIVVAGGYEIRERDYRLARTQMPSRDATRAAMREITRFYR